MRYVLILFVLGSFFGYYELLKDGYLDMPVIIGCIFLLSFQIISCIWLYKDFVGWGNFDKPEGLSLKRKK